ncbi:MAG: glucoamylase family protein [Trueperaceae bacterium]
MTPSLPVGVDGSRYQHAYSGPGGMDPYASAVSDVYQDLFGEGSYTGKGIYEVDAFEAALAGRIPENALLSHDLFEGVFARAGLASDIEVIEDAPSRYDVAAGRQHRWTRGDWQLLPWLFGRGATLGTVPRLGRWKMLDNLRRSLVAPATFLSLALCWLFPLRVGLVGESLVLAAIALPAFLPILTSLAPRRPGVRLRSHVIRVAADLQLATLQTWFTITFVADRAWRMVDSMARTLARLYLTRRHLLEWTTAAAAAGLPRPDLLGYYRQMAGSTVLVFVMAAAAVALAPSSWPLVAPFALAWLTAPALAVWASRSKPVARLAVSEAGASDLRLVARRTWRYFETFVTPARNMLPPDNFQEDPAPVVAERTSPTNIGLYLLSAVAARDFGWAGTTETVERLEATFDVIRRLPKHEGHLFNWYATDDLRVLEPAYVSSVDSGNLAGHLIAVANACEEWIGAARAPGARQGMLDELRLARQARANSSGQVGERDRALAHLLDDFEVALTTADGDALSSPAVRELNERAVASARSIGQVISDDGSDVDMAERIHWVEALHRSFVEHDRDTQGASGASLALDDRLRALAYTARALAMGMNFSFLLDTERTLLSIGYSLTENRLDTSCYDLLASEARLASLFAIAKGDVETAHWFHVGRTATPVGRGSVLLSWSGSMFEYLMPALVMHAPVGSLLEQTHRRAVVGQQAHGRSLGIPWGASESGYNARDLEFTYQYSAFGVPGLGLKRGLADNVVIAPYATGLATMVDPQAAHRNFARLADMGAIGRFGYYEALDFTRSRLPEGAQVAIVRSFMAHHQGMTIVAIANSLLQGTMRSRFHREPMIQASELLLQERMPRDVVVAHPKAEEVRAATTEARAEVPAARRLSVSAAGPPTTHLLSNGRYTVMVTAAGSGYSRWGDVAVTRWREDPTRDNWGSFVFLRDARSGELWSAGAQPIFGIAKVDVVCDEDHATFTRRDGTLTTSMEVIVSGEDDGEVRRVSLANRGRRAREIELTSYAELALTTPAADDAHPAFAKMFVQTEHIAESGALVAMRRPRSETEPRVWAAHFAVVTGTSVGVPQFESDRARFIGRGRSIATAVAIDDGLPLSNTVGTVLDPIFSLRRRVVIPPGAVARVDFWTLVASTREELLALIDKHHDSSAYGRAKTLAWTQAQVQFHHLGIDAREAAEFQRLASPILYADARYRAPPEAMQRGAGPQSGLWPHGISGDLPIVLVHIDDVEDMPQVRQLLRAHEYWRMKRLAVDLVIVNEHAASYRQELQNEIETAVRSSASRPRLGHTLAQGSVYALRADLMSSAARSLLRSVARVAVNARRGPVAKAADPLPPAPARPWAFHLPEARRATPSPTPLAPPQRSTSTNRPLPPPRPPPSPGNLEFFNGFGGFASDGREYVTILDAGRTTPAPWVNVIANPRFGFQVSADGSGYTWAENGRENQLTPWSNDPVVDPPGEAIYVRDDATGELWTATAKPIRDAGRYVARHGRGYSCFEHEVDDIALELLQFVPLGDPIKVSRLRLRNLSQTSRRLSVTAYTEWVLGRSRAATAPFITTELDAVTGAMLATNPWSTAFPGRVAFADLGGRQSSWTADRSEFLGRHGGLSAPASLIETSPLSGSTGAGLDPCAALQCKVELGAGEAVDVVSFVGECASADEARALLARYRERDLDAALEDVTRHWNDVLGAVRVKTPDRAMDLMLNGWLQYQTIACRTWARSAFYQASGAYGFRDQLQDYMASTFARPADTRRHLLRAASRQFLEGDVQHWWLPHSGQGVRTHISDDVVWLAFATATYVETSGDRAVLDEVVPFIDGPLVPENDHDAFFQPTIADESGTLFEHCARGLDLCIERTGAHGLPLIGTGDWNDGMNRVGEGGKGESVWLGWFLLRTIEMFAGAVNERDPDRALRWTTHAAALKRAIEVEAWDGAWYRRATYDDGTWLGSKGDEACQIDSIAQTWSVLSGGADPARAKQAMASLREHLIRPDDGLALLFTPPFDVATRDPGYIRGYPPGLRENGGQYSHAAMWAILAYAQLDAGDEAAELFALLNPIHHTRTPADVERYKVEPYVVAADVYSVAPHVGRGGWTWYTGSAAWMQRAGVEGILGIRREGAFLVVDPRTPSSWSGFEATVNIASTRYEIHVATPADGWREDARATVDGAPIACHRGLVRVPLDGGVHRLALTVSRAGTPQEGSPATSAVGAPSRDDS